MRRETAPAGRNAFTLLEVLVVIAIVGVLAGAAVLKLGWKLGAAQWEDALHQLEHADGLARLSARQSGRPVELVFGLSRGAIWRRDESSRRPVGAELLLNGCAIEQVRTAHARSRAGEVAIGVSAEGCSASYAVLVAGQQTTRIWIVFAGLSGECRRVEDERQIQNFFQDLSPSKPEGGGDDAH